MVTAPTFLDSQHSLPAAYLVLVSVIRVPIVTFGRLVNLLVQMPGNELLDTQTIK